MPTTRRFMIMDAMTIGNLGKIIILRIKVKYTYLSYFVFSNSLKIIVDTCLNLMVPQV